MLQLGGLPHTSLCGKRKHQYIGAGWQGRRGQEKEEEEEEKGQAGPCAAGPR